MTDQHLREMEADFADDNCLVRDYIAHGKALIAEVRRLQEWKGFDIKAMDAATASCALLTAERAAALQRAEAMRQERDAALDALVDRGRIIGQFQQQVANLAHLEQERDALQWRVTGLEITERGLTAERDELIKGASRRIAELDAALTEARRVLREVQTPPGLDDPIIWAGVPPDWFTRRDAVLAQEEK